MEAMSTREDADILIDFVIFQTDEALQHSQRSGEVMDFKMDVTYPIDAVR